jgi:hypothetical protein
MGSCDIRKLRASIFGEGVDLLRVVVVLLIWCLIYIKLVERMRGQNFRIQVRTLL